jgi:hypothetical protein
VSRSGWLTFSAVVIMVIYGLSAHYGEARYGEQTA